MVLVLWQTPSRGLPSESRRDDQELDWTNGSALSPPSCYPDTFSRFKIAGAFIVAPLFLLTFMPAAVFARSATFFFGVGMWGQPVFKFAARKFVEYVPNWKDYLELLDLRKWVFENRTDRSLIVKLDSLWCPDGCAAYVALASCGRGARHTPSTTTVSDQFAALNEKTELKRTVPLLLLEHPRCALPLPHCLLAG